MILIHVNVWLGYHHGSWSLNLTRFYEQLLLHPQRIWSGSWFRSLFEILRGASRQQFCLSRDAESLPTPMMTISIPFFFLSTTPESYWLSSGSAFYSWKKKCQSHLIWFELIRHFHSLWKAMHLFQWCSPSEIAVLLQENPCSLWVPQKNANRRPPTLFDPIMNCMFSMCLLKDKQNKKSH